MQVTTAIRQSDAESMHEIVRLELSDGIGVVTIESPPVNALSQSVREGLLNCFERAAADQDVQAIVLLCAGRTFIAGADLAELDGVIGEPGYNETFRTIEALDKPVIAAIHGTALGGGVEAALACHYRVADCKARLGFPEINLGIVPGAGGTQRLPRLIGAQAALQMFLTGRLADADEALSAGLIDAISDGDLTETAIAFARKLVREKAAIRRCSEMPLQHSEETAAFLQAERGRIAQTMPGREVPGMDIDAIEAALSLPFDDGLVREQELSDASLKTSESKAMRRLFFAERNTSRIPGIDPNSYAEIKSAGIVGAGTMGRGIAMAFANAGLPATLLDVSQAALSDALIAIKNQYDGRVKRGRMSPLAVNKCMALISATADYSGIADADVVIEAAFENMELKKEIFAKLDSICKVDAILASNTSTLDVAEIASATQRPDRVVGLHFFSPAQVMRLLEVVRTAETANDVIATSMKLATRLRKIGVLSANRFGFIGNRIMDPYGREAEHLLLEGATPRQIDTVLERFGMAMGILAVFDMAGVDVGYKVREERQDQLPDDPGFYRPSALLVERGWLGQKSGSGYYRYEPGSRERKENADAIELFATEAKRLGIEQRTISDEEIEQRCLCALVNEAAFVLEEHVALRAADIDVVYTSGYGFPRHRGGPLFYADSVGLSTICERIRGFANKLDPEYWKPAGLLCELAESGGAISEVTNV